MSDDEAFRGVELRVHGIGDHDVYSAIGSPPVRCPRMNHFCDVVGIAS